MGVSGTMAGAKLSIAGTESIDFSTPATAKTAFEAIAAWVEIKEISEVGEFGATANVLKFPVLSDDYARKSKGTRDAGDPVVVVGYVGDDAGQNALRAAEMTKYYYNFKLELPDAQDEDHSNTIIFFRAIVAAVPMSFGGNEDFVTQSYTLGIYPGPVIVPSAPILGP